MDYQTLLILFGTGLVTIFTIAHILFSFTDIRVKSLKNRRKRQLSFGPSKTNEENIKTYVDKISDFMEKSVLKHVKGGNLAEIERKLRMSKWDKYFSPSQYRAVLWFFRITGFLIFLLLVRVNFFISMYGFLWAFGMNAMLNSKVKGRKERLLREFPDFIRITQGFLSANTPLVQAVEESSVFVGDEWRPILKTFIIDTELSGLQVALDNMKREVDIFEVREFVALIKLSFEQGGSAKEAFGAQADRIKQLQHDILEMRLEKRKVYATLLQAPVMLTSIVLFAIPVIDTFISSGLF